MRLLDSIKSLINDTTSQELPPATSTVIAENATTEEKGTTRTLVPYTDHDLYLVAAHDPDHEVKSFIYEPILFIVIDNGKPVDMISQSLRKGCIHTSVFDAKRLTIGQFGTDINGWLVQQGWVWKGQSFLSFLKQCGFVMDERTSRLTNTVDVNDGPHVGDLVENDDDTFHFHRYNARTYPCKQPTDIYKAAISEAEYWAEDKGALQSSRIMLSDLLYKKFSVSDGLHDLGRDEDDLDKRAKSARVSK